MKKNIVLIYTEVYKYPVKAIEVSYYFYQTMQEDINITYSTVKMQQLVYCMVLDQFIKWKLKRRNQNIQDKTTF